MFSFLIKSLLSFTVCFIILSFHIKNKPLFYHISEFTGPLGTEVQGSLKKSFKRTIHKSQKIFTNSTPPLKDAIQSQRSSAYEKKKNEMILERLKKEEIKKLDELIKKN